MRSPLVWWLAAAWAARAAATSERQYADSAVVVTALDVDRFSSDDDARTDFAGAVALALHVQPLDVSRVKATGDLTSATVAFRVATHMTVEDVKTALMEAVETGALQGLMDVAGSSVVRSARLDVERSEAAIAEQTVAVGDDGGGSPGFGLAFGLVLLVLGIAALGAFGFRRKRTKYPGLSSSSAGGFGSGTAAMPTEAARDGAAADAADDAGAAAPLADGDADTAKAIV